MGGSKARLIKGALAGAAFGTALALGPLAANPASAASGGCGGVPGVLQVCGSNPDPRVGYLLVYSQPLATGAEVYGGCSGTTTAVQVQAAVLGTVTDPIYVPLVPNGCP